MSWQVRATSGLYPLNEDQIAERGARLARRDDREYREYLREEQRRQTGCPAREVVLDQRIQATRSAEFIRRALGVEREDDALPADPVQDAPLQIRLVEPRPRRRRSGRDPSGGNRVSKTGRRGRRARDGLETRP